MRGVLYLLFVLSGAAGLIYESIWSRYLGLFVGHSAYAQIIVLAIFLGGMSVGALLIGQRSTRLQDPLLWYAGIELLVGVVGLLFHEAFLVVTQTAYAVLFPALAGSPALTLVQWTLAGGLILPQSVLLGATFPCMSAGVLRRTAERPGRVLARLYFANSMGAALGVLVAGFYLVVVWGLPGTVRTAAALNILVAVGAYIVAYGTRRTLMVPRVAETTRVGATAACPRQESSHPERLWRLLLFASLATALASFIYEIAWIRMLALVLGSATHAFELMLSAFILGLALGALWIGRWTDRLREPVRTLGLVQWLMGAAALATLPLYMASFTWMTGLLTLFGKTEPGYLAFTLARYGLCLAIMLPATFCAGMTLPLMTNTLVTSGQGERAIGWIYGTNTLGSIVGVMLAGLVLLPWLGLKALLLVGAACDMAIGVLVTAHLERPIARRFWLVSATTGATIVVVLLASWGATWDHTLLSSGVFRYGRLPQPGSREVLFYQDGRTATVAGVRLRDGSVTIATNGKPDASLTREWFSGPQQAGELQPLREAEATQTLLALVTLAHNPHGRNAAVIGHGAGHSSHMLLGSPHLTSLVTIEIEPQMIAGSRIFYPANRRVFDDPRATFAIDDARSFLATEPQRYDLILSEPSDPSVSGATSLFTREFYARAVSLLSPHGVFGQWLPLYELNDDLVLSVLASVHANFRSYRLFLLGHNDLLIVASHMAALPAPDWSVFTLPHIATDLAAFVPFTPESLEATFVLDRQALAPLLDTWHRQNSDFFPTLDLGAEKARYLQTHSLGVVGLHAERFQLVAPFVGRRQDFSTTGAIPIPSHPRMRARALGAILRDWRALNVSASATAAAPDGKAVDQLWQWAMSFPGFPRHEVQAAVRQLQQWHTTLAAAEPPTNWRQWLKHAVSTEALLHGGTAGTADEAFYEGLRQYLARHTPPPAVCHAARFLEGLARWDFTTAAQAADQLLPSALEGTSWLPVDSLRDGAVVAKLILRDVTGARRFFEALAPQTERQPSDLRSRLLHAYIMHADALPRLASTSSKVTHHCPAQEAYTR